MYEVKKNLPIPTKLRKGVTVNVNDIRLIGKDHFSDGRVLWQIDVHHGCSSLWLMPTL